MKINCPQCSATFSIDDSLLMGKGVKAQCPACGSIQVVRPGGQESSSEKKKAEPPVEPAPAKPRPPEMPISILEGGGTGQNAADAEMQISHDPLDDVFGPGAGGNTPDPFAGIELQTENRSAMQGGKDAKQKPPPLPALPPLAPGTQDASVPMGTTPAPDGQTAATSDRCERCGAMIGPGGGLDALCPTCIEQARVSAAKQENREWRVKQHDGVVLGPLTIDEVKEKYQQGSITAEDRVARGEGEFKLISSFPEFSVFFRRPGESIEMTFKHPPRQKRSVVATVVVLILLASGGFATWFYFTQMAGGPGDGEGNVLDEVVERFTAEMPEPKGTKEEAVAEGHRLMLRDDRLSYLQADKAFKTTVLLDPEGVEACAGWVQNRSMLDKHFPDVAMRKLALDYIDYTLERNPDHPSLLRAKAYLYFSLGRIEEARKLASKALEKNPDDPQSKMILGASYLESSTEMAIDYFNQALELNPKLAAAARLLGEAYIRLGKFNKALAYFKARLEQDPGQFDVLHATAKVYLQVGKYAQARETYEMILAAEPGLAEALVALCRLHTQVFGQPQKALKVIEDTFTHAKDIGPGDRAQIRVEQSISHRILGNLQAAKEAIEQALGDDPILVPAMYARAVLEQNSGKVGEAMGHFKELITHMPNSARLRARLAEVHTMVPDFQKAVQVMKSAVDLAPEDLDLHLMMAVLHIFLDNPTQAYGWLKKSTNLDPLHSEKHRSLSAFYDDPSLLQLTTKRALQAVEKYEEDTLILSLCGVVLMRAGKTEKARNMLLRALELDPECFPANLYLGFLYLKQGKASSAVGFLKQAYDADTLHGVASSTYGLALLRTGKVKESIEMFETVLKSAPGDLVARLGLAEAYLKRKKKRKAVQELLRIYQGDSENLLAKKLLFKLGH